jgi:nicotinic acid mononucleotide adenylyltransferase
MAKKIALFGGSFNPPGMHHLNIVYSLMDWFDVVYVVPCGDDRPDKSAVGSVSSEYRRAMAFLAFDGISQRVIVDDSDLVHRAYTRTYELQARYAREGEVWHAVGADIVRGGARGRSQIHEIWMRGAVLWRAFNFAVFSRAGYPIDKADLPPKHMHFPGQLSGASSDIRTMIAQGKPIDGLVPRQVEVFIRMNKLYQNG